MASHFMRSEAEIAQAMHEHGNAVYVLALAQTRSQADAQDVAQDVFVSLLTCGKAFRDAEHLRAWLLRATLNRCADLYRTPWKRRVQKLPDEEPDVEDVSPGPEDAALSELQATQVWQALRRLPETLRAAAVLFYLEERPVSEIADILQCRPGTVRVRLARARAQLRDALGEPAETNGGGRYATNGARPGAQPGTGR